MQLTITTTHVWQLLQVLSSLTQIAAAFGVLARYYERRHLEALGRDVPDLTTFGDESPYAPEQCRQRARHHRVPAARLGGCYTSNRTLSNIDISRPKLHRRGFTPASYPFVRPRLCYQTSGALRHRPLPSNAKSENESELSESGATSSTPSREESVRSNPETDALWLPKPQQRSPQR